MNSRLNFIVICLLAVWHAGGCAPQAGGLHPTAGGEEISQVSLPKRIAPLVLGEQSCAASGCHGRAFNGGARDWRSAYSIWDQEDPHRQAFAVLYSDRSLEMFRNLHPEQRLDAGPPQDADFAGFLSQRCLGCHATSLRGRDAVALADARDVPEYYLAGVTCESCHGPANGWLHTHYLANFARTTPGFIDTKRLHTRAERCVGCHVGPMIAASGRTYDVNHDLIAAGHPRLTFELSTYLANYPKHWNENETGQSHHARAWAAGQEAAARQLTRQIEHRLKQAKRSPNEAAWPDFSNFDCYDCHHTLSDAQSPRSRAAQLAGRHGLPRPALLPLANLRLLAVDGSSLAEETELVERMLMSSWTRPVEKIVQPTEYELSLLTSDEGGPLVAELPGREARSRHIAALQALLDIYRMGGSQSPTWDEAVQFYLAVAAMVRDLEPAGEQLRAANRSLEAALGPHNFEADEPQQYESPTGFDSARLQTPLDQIDRALAELAGGGR